MTLNIELEEVPFAILEAVKARILAQRRRIPERQQPSPSLQPGPQSRAIGSSGKAWRLPRPAAVPLDDGNQVGHLWMATTSQDVNNTGVTASSELVIVGAGAQFRNRVRKTTMRIGYKRTTKLYCGNGSQSITVDHGLRSTPQILPAYSGFPVSPPFGSLSASVAQEYDDETRLVFLPAGDDRFILFFLATNNYLSVNVTVNQTGAGEAMNTASPYAACDPPAAGSPYQVSPGLFYRDLSSFTAVKNLARVSRCFVVSNTGIRELQIPGAVQSLLDSMISPEQQIAQVVETAFVSGVLTATQLVAQTTIPTSYFSTPFGDGGFDGLLSDGNTPAVFYAAITQNGDPAVPWQQRIGEIARDVPSSLQWLVEDTSSGIYRPATWNNLSWAQAFVSQEPYNYGTWNTPGEEPTYTIDDDGYSYDRTKYEPDPDATHAMAPGLTAPDGNISLYTVWDWGDPDYCRQVCLALGFSDADLVP